MGISKNNAVNKTDVPESCFNSPESIFRYLTVEDIEQFDIDTEPKYYAKGTIIYTEGSRINGFYCVQNGIIKIYKTGIDGREQIIRFAKTGDVMGFRSTITAEHACTTAKVIEAAYICHVPGQVVNELIRKNGDFAHNLLTIACKELGEANDYITELAQKTVRERLAEELIHLKKTFDLDNDNFLKVSLTREELANIVGTATESVIRLLSEFKQDKLIELQGRKIKLLDVKRLTKIAHLPQ